MQWSVYSQILVSTFKGVHKVICHILRLVDSQISVNTGDGVLSHAVVSVFTEIQYSEYK